MTRDEAALNRMEQALRTGPQTTEQLKAASQLKERTFFRYIKYLEQDFDIVRRRHADGQLVYVLL